MIRKLPEIKPIVERVKCKFCPFCLDEISTHTEDICRNLPGREIPIPRKFKAEVKERTPVIFLFTMGYPFHGKSIFLSILFEKITQDLPRIWKNDGYFCSALNEETFDGFKRTFIKPIKSGELAESTRTVIPIPMILHLEKLPSDFKYNEIILVGQDFPGEFCKDQNRMQTARNLFVNIDNPIILFSLSDSLEGRTWTGKDMERSDGSSSASIDLHELFNRYFNVLYESGLSEEDIKMRKRPIVVFTKADRFWKKREYGPLAEMKYWEENSLSKIYSSESRKDYLRDMIAFSDRIKKFVSETYVSAYRFAIEKFNDINFVALSSLGREPEEKKEGVRRITGTLESRRILDPLLFLLLNENLISK